MKRRFGILTVLACVCLVMSLCSCELDESKNGFYGGELLDDERLSEIKNEILTTDGESVSETYEIEEKTCVDDDAQTESAIDETHSREESSTGEETLCDGGESDVSETYGSDDTCVETCTDESGEATVVYWTEGGRVWHVKEDCYRIKNSENVLSGTVDEAMEAGKERVCSSCGK